MPGLKVRIDGETRTVDVEGTETVVRLDRIRRRPRELQLDPEGWWLMEATVAEGNGERGTGNGGRRR
jgi:hypothetical protein